MFWSISEHLDLLSSWRVEPTTPAEDMDRFKITVALTNLSDQLKAAMDKIPKMFINGVDITD